jgi:hypothetical protein
MSAEATGWVWRHSPWKGRHVRFLLHLAVADVVNDAHGNEFWMSQAALAEKVGCKRGTVCEWFAEAQDCQLVTLLTDNSKAGRPNRYRLELPAREVSAGRTALSAGRTRGVRVADTELKEHKRTQETTIAKQTTNEAAQMVLDAWVVATGRDAGRVKLNAKRTAAVAARMREGYSADDLVAAVRGIALSRWHMGENPDGKKYDDFLVAVRDGERVEKFRDLYDAGGDGERRSAVDVVLDLFDDGVPQLGTGA